MTEPLSAQSSTNEPVYTIYVCPDCGEHIVDSDYDPEVGRIWGHYHEPPEWWPGVEDPWINAVAVEVVPR